MYSKSTLNSTSLETQSNERKFLPFQAGNTFPRLLRHRPRAAGALVGKDHCAQTNIPERPKHFTSWYFAALRQLLNISVNDETFVLLN